VFILGWFSILIINYHLISEKEKAMAKTTTQTGQSNNRPAGGSTAERPAHARRGMVGVEAFARRKGGTTKAIKEFQKRKEKKRTQTAQTLRRYRKVMKQEGYEPGAGASRKRQHQQLYSGKIDPEEEQDKFAHTPQEQADTEELKKNSAHQDGDEDSHSDKDDSKRVVSEDGKRRKKEKSNPFAKALKKAKEAVSDATARQEEQEKRDKERRSRLNERKKKTRLMAQRTQRGQPIMKNMMGNILDKLQRQHDK
jgi:hypothetical protein